MSSRVTFSTSTRHGEYRGGRGCNGKPKLRSNTLRETHPHKHSSLRLQKYNGARLRDPHMGLATLQLPDMRLVPPL